MEAADLERRRKRWWGTAKTMLVSHLEFSEKSQSVLF